MANFILGTRGSLLAVTQSTLIKNQLEKIFPEHVFQIKTIKTQGDQIIDKPLWQVEGKDFFTKELDDALINKDVDFVIHSYKDLGSVRPQAIRIAAITKRNFAHDLMLIHQDTILQMKNNNISSIKIGTSSPRRQYLLQENIEKFLPNGQNFQYQFLNLRGNVNSRIKKLIDKEYDIICLAAAGLDRLATLPESQKELSSLLKNIKLKFLPLSVFPCAPAQGALAIECLKDNHALFNILNSLNHDTSENEIQREREIFQAYGGGCHLSLGVFSKNISDQTYTTISKGNVDSQPIDRNLINNKNISEYQHHFSKSPFIFLGLTSDRIKKLKLPSCFIPDCLSQKNIILEKSPIPAEENALYYLTSEHTISAYKKHHQSHHFLWASGSQLHQQLADLGYWVLGDNDSLGSSMLENFLNSALGQLYLGKIPTVQLSFSGKSQGTYLNWPAYEKNYSKADSSYLEKLKKCKVFFWTSHSEYTYFTQNFSFILQDDVSHFCGLGTTYLKLSKLLPKIIPVPNILEFIKIATINNGF